MSPKSLSTLEKNLQKEKLLAKGGDLLAAYGVRKTSVEDITKAANMAKGTFYQHFESKEFFFFELFVQYHKQWFSNAEIFFTQPGDIPLQNRVREFIKSIFRSPVYMAIFKYHDELEEMLQSMQQLSQQSVNALMYMELEAYERLLQIFHIDTQKVRAGVISNYIHVMYLGISNTNIMDMDCDEDTFEVLLNGLIAYIFGGGL